MDHKGSAEHELAPAMGWRETFDKHQQRLIVDCCAYYDDSSRPLQPPDHALMIIIAEMAALLDGWE